MSYQWGSGEPAALWHTLYPPLILKGVSLRWIVEERDYKGCGWGGREETGREGGSLWWDNIDETGRLATVLSGGTKGPFTLHFRSPSQVAFLSWPRYGPSEIGILHCACVARRRLGLRCGRVLWGGVGGPRLSQIIVLLQCAGRA